MTQTATTKAAATAYGGQISSFVTILFFIELSTVVRSRHSVLLPTTATAFLPILSRFELHLLNSSADLYDNCTHTHT